MGVEALQLNVQCIMFDEAWLGTVRCVCVCVCFMLACDSFPNCLKQKTFIDAFCCMFLY